jgi:hypothetical protein
MQLAMGCPIEAKPGRHQAHPSFKISTC